MMDLAALLSLPISLAGFLAAGLAMHRTSRDALGQPVEGRAKQRLRLAACLAFILAFAVAISGGMVPLVGGFMLLFASAGVAIALFTWWPRWTPVVAKVAAVLGVASLAVAIVRAF